MISVTTVLIHPSSLYSEGLGRILVGTPFQIARAFRASETLPHDLSSEQALLFIIGGRDPAEVAKSVVAVAGRFKHARIVVIGERIDGAGVILALEGGAHGYLRDSMSSEALVKSLELVMMDETVLPTEFVRRLPTHLAPIQDSAAADAGETDFREGAHPSLSDRELSILKKLASGSSNKVIANDLSITEATVKVHVKSILRKIHAKNRTQAAIWAVTNRSDAATTEERELVSRAGNGGLQPAR